MASNIVVGCDLEMCGELQKSGFPAARLLPLQPSAPDPLGAQLVVATPVIRNQFGTRLATVYAPLVIAGFGSGAERVDVRYIAPDGSKAFEAQLATYRRDRITAGRQLLGNNHVQASAAAAPGTPCRAGRSASSCNAFDTCGSNAAAADSVREPIAWCELQMCRCAALN